MEPAMKVVLAHRYRIWMLALLPATLGVGTAALWARSLSWPARIDAHGLTLRSRRRLAWRAIRQITVVRDYLDGHVARIDIHRHGGVSQIPVRALHDGERIAALILTLFKQSRRERASDAPALLPELPAAWPRASKRSSQQGARSGDDGGIRIPTAV
jgi:hypothetical protein